MIWRIVTRYAELSERGLAVTPAFAYALLDGVFQHALLRHLAGDATAAGELTRTSACCSRRCSPRLARRRSSRRPR